MSYRTLTSHPRESLSNQLCWFGGDSLGWEVNVLALLRDLFAQWVYPSQRSWDRVTPWAKGLSATNYCVHILHSTLIPTSLGCNISQRAKLFGDIGPKEVDINLSTKYVHNNSCVHGTCMQTPAPACMCLHACVCMWAHPHADTCMRTCTHAQANDSAVGVFTPYFALWAKYGVNPHSTIIHMLIPPISWAWSSRSLDWGNLNLRLLASCSWDRGLSKEQIGLLTSIIDLLLPTSWKKDLNIGVNILSLTPTWYAHDVERWNISQHHGHIMWVLSECTPMSLSGRWCWEMFHLSIISHSDSWVSPDHERGLLTWVSDIERHQVMFHHLHTSQHHLLTSIPPLMMDRSWEEMIMRATSCSHYLLTFTSWSVDHGSGLLRASSQ